MNCLILIAAVFGILDMSPDSIRMQTAIQNRIADLATFDQSQLDVLLSEKQWLTTEIINWNSDFLRRNLVNNFHIFSTGFGVEMLHKESLADFDYNDWDTKSYPLMIPVAAHNHWFTIIVYKEKDSDIFQIYHYDFFYQYDAFYTEMKDAVSRYLTNMFPSLIIRMNHYKFNRKYQIEDYNCGTFSMFVMHNFAKFDAESAKRIISNFGNTISGINIDNQDYAVRMRPKAQKDSRIKEFMDLYDAKLKSGLMDKIHNWRMYFFVILEVDLNKKRKGITIENFQTNTLMPVDSQAYAPRSESHYYTLI